LENRHVLGPTRLHPELAHEICRRLTEGETLKVICKGKGMPAASTVRLWVLDNLEGFADLYARARLVGYHTMADELVEISDREAQDAAAVNRDRLRVDTRKWLLSKALPKIYGDKLTAELTGKDGAPLVERGQTPLEFARSVAFLFEQAKRDLAAKEREAEQGAVVAKGEGLSTRH
jgi:hypothetical protein